MISGEALLKQYKEHKRISMGALARQYKNTRMCQAFYAGDTMDITGKVSYRSDDGQLKFALCQFNKVKPYVNAVNGFLIQTRSRFKYAARAPKEAQAFYSDYVNYYSEYNRDNCRADQIETRQNLDMLVNGYGVTDTFLTFGVGYASRNPDGEIGMMRLDPNKYWWDPSAREMNIIDRKWDGYTKQYYLDEALDLFDNATEDDFEAEKQEPEGDYAYNPMGGVKNLIREYYDFADEAEKIINVDFYQWAEIETYYRGYNPIYEQSDPEAVLNIKAFLDLVKEDNGDDLLDPKAEILNCSAESKKRIAEHLDVQFEAYKRTSYFSAVISGKKVFTSYRNLSQQSYTRQVKTGDFDEKNKIWVGMVNAMVEPQKYFNKSITEFLYTIANLSKGGVMYEEGAIEKIKEFESGYLRPDANVEVSKDAIKDGRIQPKREPYQPTGVESIIELSNSSFTDVTGLDKSFLGSSENKLETAALQRQRIKQAVNTLACYVDAVILYGKEHAGLMLDFMRELASFGGDRQFRLFDAEGEAELVPVKLDHFVDEYDIDVQEAPDTELEKAERREAFASMGSLLIQSGDPAGKILFGMALDDMQIDARKKAKAMQALMPGEQIDPMEHNLLKQRVQQLEGLVQSGELQKTQSEIEKNLAQAQKTSADRIKVLEDARQTAKETDSITRASPVTVNV